jgi:hypothetical protein
VLQPRTPHPPRAASRRAAARRAFKATRSLVAVARAGAGHARWEAEVQDSSGESAGAAGVCGAMVTPVARVRQLHQPRRPGPWRGRGRGASSGARARCRRARAASTGRPSRATTAQRARGAGHAAARLHTRWRSEVLYVQARARWRERKPRGEATAGWSPRDMEGDGTV